MSKYGELVNAYEAAIADDDKQDRGQDTTVDKFDYNQLPEDIKKVIEFWRREYCGFDIVLDDNIMMQA